MGATPPREDRQLTKLDSEAQREELNRRAQELSKRLTIAPSAQRDEILEEMTEMGRELQELSLDDRLRSSMEGGSEG